MATTRYVALLRGINVGGNNVIKMSDLRASFEKLGFSDVQSYIQSGNVLFSSKYTSTLRLTRTIEQALSDRFGYVSQLVLVSARDLREIVGQAPAGFGKLPLRYRYDVLFLRRPLEPAEVLEQITPRPGVDVAIAGDHAVYFRRLTSKAAQSNLPRLVQRPVYKGITIRNWNTTTKLAALVSST